MHLSHKNFTFTQGLSVYTAIMIKGILLDVDGTLVASNGAHAHAWVDAFAQYGYEVPFEEVRRLIGMGGDKLISSIRPDLDEEEGDGRLVKEARTKIFLDKYAPELQPTHGARGLVLELQKRGLRTIVASSSKQDELEVLLKAAGVDELLTEATTSDDAESSKPDPDILQVAMDKIGLDIDEVLMIGDTPYDIDAAIEAGVHCVAVRSGGWDDADLDGATAIFNDPADLQAHLDNVLA